ncbi:NADH-ubiquinone oxidoreductase-F iron-sulfur binding region domain-containing protein [Candidatus Neomarinimicrobiota bacterium]
MSFRQRILKETAMKEAKPCLVICAGTGGQASGSNDVMRIIKRQIIERNLHESISLRITGCQGFCEMDPFIVVEPGNHLYPKVNMEDVPRIIDSALAGEIIDDLIYKEKHNHQHYTCLEDIPFFKKQTRTILGENQKIDPIRIMDYFERGGYAGFENVMSNPDPERIIQEITKSGLRGRGGAGFSTGVKWSLARNAGNGQAEKFLICNADEGDPGAYMDRSLLEGNPHLIIEGMIIAAVGIGAKQGFVYVRSEYPLAIKHILVAIRQAEQMGLLGEDILGTGIDLNIDIVRGAGAFVCGEETALIRSIEGSMGEPRQRPPYPVIKGLRGRPTCINNVETLANIPTIINLGAEAYTKIGVPQSTGTKIFSLVGKITNTGLVEVPLGMKISDVVYNIGGGPPGKAKIKAIQTGGPSGGCIPASMFDLPIDYDSLADAGTIMGSGGMIVMDQNTCMVDVAKYFMNFLQGESCGKCFTCRKGTQRMYEILDGITRGEGTIEQLALLEELALAVEDTTMCGLGQTASNPVLSTLRYFREEYLEHIQNKRCSAGVCKDLVGAPCQNACPLGTEVWRYIAQIQRGQFEEAYRVIRENNPFPSVCARVCNHSCEDHCRAGTSGGDSIAIRTLKRFITDRIDPAVYQASHPDHSDADPTRVAVIGAGPAGLTAAHQLACAGYQVEIFEAEDRPGGMLISGIPAYRLPPNIIQKEIEALISDNVILTCNTALGSDITIDGLFDAGFKSVYLAMGAHKSRQLNLDNEDTDGVFSGMDFLKAFNLKGTELGKGRVCVVGGGNSAIDAARVAIRQQGVESVTILYRRTRQEMPAYDEEIKAALEEGVNIETLITPVKIHAESDRLVAVECIRNVLGDVDASGRRWPVPIPGSEMKICLETLVIAVSEESATEAVASMGIKIGNWQNVAIDKDTCITSRPGVFAGGDVVTGPNTVVDAIAAGKRAAVAIARYLRGEDLHQSTAPRLPQVLLEPNKKTVDIKNGAKRIAQPTIPVSARTHNFTEVVGSISAEEALSEVGRCLRCDLEFTRPVIESVKKAGADGVET